MNFFKMLLFENEILLKIDIGEINEIGIICIFNISFVFLFFKLFYYFEIIVVVS